MNYKFNNKEQYLTKKEQAHLDEFFKFEPKGKTIYENPEGQKRLPLMVKRPRGCVAPDTVWGPTIEGARWYHTPLATAESPVAHVFFRNPDTMETGSCTSVEWLEWLGESFKQEDKPKPAPTGMDKYIENQKDAIIHGNVQKVDKEEFDRHAGGEDPEWQKVIQSKSTSQTKRFAKRSKKSSTKK